MESKIDFVVTYVDDKDSAWINKKKQYLDNTIKTSNESKYFRNWDNFKYWFRAVDKYASWVNKIYLVTDHQVPSWLNTDNDKLVIVNHEDYLDKKDLPVFNSNAIELKLHLIKGLNEQFVYFNDDMFLNDYVKEEDFFKDGLPRDYYGEHLLVGDSNLDSFNHFILNNMDLINQKFNKKEVYKKNRFKYFKLMNFKELFNSLYFKPYKYFINFNNPHIATSYLKSTFNEVWEDFYEPLNNTCHNRFRDRRDVNVFLFRYYQLLNGNFIPRSHKFGHYFCINDVGNNKELISAIVNNKYKCICINDDNINIEFNKVKKEINDAFEAKLSQKSQFER